MNCRQKRYCMMLAVLLASLVGCNRMADKINVVNEKPVKQRLELGLMGHEGTMKYELEDAYVTTELNENGIDINMLDESSFIYCMNGNGKMENIGYPEYFEDYNKGILKSPAKLYVCRIKVTNQDATYSVEDEYKDPYIFRADNMFLCYLPDKMSGKEQIKYKNVEYYSLRKDGDYEWATYELKPGESITYDVGFVLGDYLDEKELDMKKGKLYLSNTGGSEDGEYYNIDWSER